MKYRIKEVTGNITLESTFYIQRRRRKLFGQGYRWINVHTYTNWMADRPVEIKFDDLVKAQNWITKKTQTSTVKYYGNT